jgi:hypothetical protein
MKTRKQLAIIAIIVLACTACDTGSSTGDSVKGDNPGNGPTIYTAGYYQKRYNNVACYWEGTTRTDLTDGVTNACAYDIAVSGGKVYTAGYYF